MKLDQQTLTVLKNFQQINPSIEFREGNVIYSVSSTNTVLSKATLEVEFPKTFCISDLKRFLQVAATLKNAELEFDENYLTFVEGNKRIRYTYANSNTIKKIDVVPRPFSPSVIFFEFTLTADMLKEAIMGTTVLGHEGIVIKGEDGKLFIRSYTDSNADLFSMEIGETPHTFNFMFENEKLNFIPKDFHVTLSKNRFMHLSSNNLDYWVACLNRSTLQVD